MNQRQDRISRMRLTQRGLAGRRKERGNSLVEQALVLVIFLTIMFGIIDFGRALYTYHFVSNAAREATRWASVRSSTSSLGAADNTTVKSFVSNVSGMGLDPAKITTDTEFLNPPNSSPGCPANKPGCIVQVTVNYNYSFFFPFMPAGTLTMTSGSEMVITQ